MPNDLESPNFYASLPIERWSERRRDPAFIATRLEHVEARLVPVWRTKNLVRTDDRPQAVWLARETLAHVPGERVYLGDWQGVPYFALDLSHVEEHDLPAHAPEGAFVDLRGVGAAMDRAEGGLLALARGLAWWHARNRHCGVCGAPTESRAGGHVLACTNPACGAEHFPRTDPAVIMLIVRGDRCLLGRNRRFPFPMYSTLAGFVEPGESLEDCVRRETFEEAGIRVGRVEYRSSQPWPFPASIMLGFWGEALTEDIVMDDDELIDVIWADREFLRRAHDPEKFRLPRTDSIARRLIEDWIAAG
ncbi:MAG: NAD(+) diphosphatase [Azospirillum sp.]|nr:NAD(+) diphosphatase [Azospirillum sp.]MCA3268204.1 NAD(+) diphosphatase [Azospirillum sp.]MCZ8125082.1 NAD(+) diphosphatase [Magnetospirillum sp.]